LGFGCYIIIAKQRKLVYRGSGSKLETEVDIFVTLSQNILFSDGQN